MEKLEAIQIGVIEGYNKHTQAYRVYDKDGVSPTLTSCLGGGSLVPHIVVVYDETDTDKICKAGTRQELLPKHTDADKR